jgi:hypothetical protein
MRPLGSAIDRYIPADPPQDAKGLNSFLQQELNRVSAMLSVLAAGQDEKTYVVPPKPRDGMRRYFDGTSANPTGAGEGVYEYYAGAWNRLSAGYGTGAGGTVVQATNKATGVTLDKPCGLVTLNNAALGSQTTVSFTLTNSSIAATDFVAVQHASAGTLGAYNFAVAPAAGSCVISVRNVHTGSLSEAIVLRFFVHKAATA